MEWRGAKGGGHLRVGRRTSWRWERGQQRVRIQDSRGSVAPRQTGTPEDSGPRTRLGKRAGRVQGGQRAGSGNQESTATAARVKRAKAKGFNEKPAGLPSFLLCEIWGHGYEPRGNQIPLLPLTGASFLPAVPRSVLCTNY